MILKAVSVVVLGVDLLVLMTVFDGKKLRENL